MRPAAVLFYKDIGKRLITYVTNCSDAAAYVIVCVLWT